MSVSNRLKLFYSYSHKDEKHHEALINHLTLLKREGLISEWHDRKIVPGQDWSKEIDAHLNEADIVLMLISADFIASEYCYKIEMMKALEQHEKKRCCVIPIMIRPCDLGNLPICKIHGLPKDMRPVTKWDNQDEAWMDIANGVREAIKAQAKLKKKLPKEDEPTRFLQKGFTIDRMDPTIYRVAWSPDCQYVATGDNNKQILIWETNPTEADFGSGSYKLAEPKDILEKGFHSGTVRGLAWSPDGRRLASAGSDNLVLVWDIDFNGDERQKPELRLHGHAGTVNCLVWIVDNRLLSGSRDTEIICWNPMTGDNLIQFTNANQSVLCMACSPNGKHLAVGSPDGIIRIYDWLAENKIQELQGHTGRIYCLTWASDTTLASASEDKTIRLWDLKTPERSIPLRGHEKEVLAISFSGDGRLLASQSSDMTLRFWNVAQASPVDYQEWECSAHPDTGMGFDPSDPKYPLFISLGKKDHVFRVWKVSVEEMLKSANKRSERDNEEWNRKEIGMISTTLRDSKHHKIAFDACDEAGHSACQVENISITTVAEKQAKAIEIAEACDFYLGVFCHPSDLIFAEQEINRVKKCYFFFPKDNIIDRATPNSEQILFEKFRADIEAKHYVFEFCSEEGLRKTISDVLKRKFYNKRHMIQNSPNGLYQ